MARDPRDVMYEYIIAFLVVDTLAVGLRLYSRGYVVKALGADDWAMVVAWTGFVVTSIILLLALHYGLGVHMAELALDPPRLQNALKYFILGQMTYGFSSGAVKISVGLLLYRIAAVPIYRYIILVSIIIVGIWSLLTVILIGLQCQPLSFAWKGSKTGKCFHPSVLVNVGYAFSGMDIASSWLYSLLPIPMLWKIQMPWKAKIGVMAILAIGAVSSAATIIRLRGLILLGSSQDILFEIVTTNTWSVVEVSVAILAGCLATYRPLLKQLHIHGFGDSGGSAPAFKLSDNTGGQARSGQHELNSLKHNRKDRKMGLHDVTIQDEHDSDSQELILPGDNIRKHTEIQVQYGNPRQGNPGQSSMNRMYV